MQSQSVLEPNPKHHPVKFLASIWQQKLKSNFGKDTEQMTGQEYGQLKTLRKHEGDLTLGLIEWVMEPVNWSDFCQRVPVELKITLKVPEYPHVGFLLKYRGIALRTMRRNLINANAGGDFVKNLDQREYESFKTFLLVAYVEGKPERSAKIEAAKTLTDIRKVFIEIMDEVATESTSDTASTLKQTA